MLKNNASGFFPYTPATNLLYALREALAMLHEEGLTQVFARHQRHGDATRAAVRGWGLEIVCEDPREYSNSLTAMLMPDGHDADRLRTLILERFDMSLGTGLGKLAGRAFRIGHLGSFNDLMLAGTLCGVEMGLRLAGVPHTDGGVMAALDSLGAPAGKRNRYCPEALPDMSTVARRRWRRHDAEADSPAAELPRQTSRYVRRERRRSNAS